MGQASRCGNRLYFLGLMTLALGCTANILGDAPTPGGSSDPTVGGPGAVAGGPGVVEGSAGSAALVPQAVPKLLRVSNDEYQKHHRRCARVK